MRFQWQFLFCVVLIVPVLSFDCPEPRRKRRPKVTYHRHETHCDKYYVCSKDLRSTEETCPDGMLFNYKHVAFGRKCVLPTEGDCGGLTEFQPAQPSGPCKRQNGYFTSDDDDTCRKYVQCIEGAATPLECPAGTAFAVKSGNCDWPDNVKTCNLNKLYGFTCPKNFLVLVLKHGPNIKFPDPNDCRSFFTCSSSGRPRKYGCELGRVFNDKTQMCDEPENVEGCEKYYKSSEEEEDSYYYGDYDTEELEDEDFEDFESEEYEESSEEADDKKKKRRN